MANAVNIGVLVSGNGSNLQAIIDRIEDGTIPARITCVISNNAGAYGLQRAEKHGIPAVHMDHRIFSGRESYDTALVEALKQYDVQLVVLAGFMRIITPVFLDAFPQAVMNIHPALLPSFPGIHAQRQALDYGVKFTGCTTHFVDAGTDTGPIIMQSVVPILTDDTEESLSARIQIEEHRIFPESVKLFVEGRLTVDGRRVLVR